MYIRRHFRGFCFEVGWFPGDVPCLLGFKLMECSSDYSNTEISNIELFGIQVAHFSASLHWYNNG